MCGLRKFLVRKLRAGKKDGTGRIVGLEVEFGEVGIRYIIANLSM